MCITSNLCKEFRMFYIKVNLSLIPFPHNLFQVPLHSSVSCLRGASWRTPLPRPQGNRRPCKATNSCILTWEQDPSSPLFCWLSWLWRTHSPKRCQTSQSWLAAISQHMPRGDMPRDPHLHPEWQALCHGKPPVRWAHRPALGLQPSPSVESLLSRETLGVHHHHGAPILHLDQI